MGLSSFDEVFHGVVVQWCCLLSLYKPACLRDNGYDLMVVQQDIPC